MDEREALSAAREPRASRAVLEAHDLAVTPPGAARPAVEGVSLTVAPGEWVALVGENGGGKTSLLHALAGLWPHSAGTLTLDGRAFGPGRREAGEASIAAVLQDPSSQLLQPTVAEELAFSARNLGLAEETVARDVARRSREFDLEGDLSLDPATLSAGRQQQVLLAAALVARPRLLFADEPAAHLDAAGRNRALEVIRREVEEGMAVIWATQDPEETRSATRTLEVGRSGRAPAPAGHQPWVASAPEAESMGPLVRIRISPTGAEGGPRVRVPGPLEIGIGFTGVLAVVGPNGAGKSVLLCSVAGLDPIAQVAVTWGAHGVPGGVPPSPPPIMALQYPELQVFEDLVKDELVFAAASRGMERSRALDEASNHLRDLGFDSSAMLSRRTWTLSTGEKRLIEVVAALIAPASLVILDEPTAGLDAARRVALARLVGRRSGSGPVLIASQDWDWLSLVGGGRFAIGE